LLSNFLDENFSADLLELVAKVKNDDYYVQMMQAWFFATALAKQYDATISLLESKKLEPFVQNKTIQKSRESQRISSETKKYLLKKKEINKKWLQTKFNLPSALVPLVIPLMSAFLSGLSPSCGVARLQTTVLTTWCYGN